MILRALPTFFTLEGKRFFGWTFKEKWMDYACPYFEIKTIIKISEAKLSQCEIVVRGGLVFIREEGELIMLPQEFIVTVNGIKSVYFLGRGLMWREEN